MSLPIAMPGDYPRNRQGLLMQGWRVTVLAPGSKDKTLTVFSDRAMTERAGNPFMIEADGRMPRRYIGERHKLRFESGGGQRVEEFDDIEPGASAVTFEGMSNGS